MKTIAKFFRFVIFAVLSAVTISSAFISSDPQGSTVNSPYGPPQIIGKIKSNDITESSGLAASRCSSNVLWTHNDSGDDAYIFAIDLKGNNLGTWKVPNAQNIDWEDIDAYKDGTGKCFLYIADTGDNKLKRHEHSVYRVREPLPLPENAGSDRKHPLTTENSDVLRFVYPDFDQDAETLMVHPQTGDIYVVTKRVSGPAGVYRIKPSFENAEVQRAEKVAELSVPAVPNGFVTGGDISPDGRRMVICDYTQGYEWTLPSASNGFDEIWTQTPEVIDLGQRKGGESVCYSVDGASVFATSEGRSSPVIEVKRKN